MRVWGGRKYHVVLFLSILPQEVAWWKVDIEQCRQWNFFFFTGARDVSQAASSRAQAWFGLNLVPIVVLSLSNKGSDVCRNEETSQFGAFFACAG